MHRVKKSHSVLLLMLVFLLLGSCSRPATLPTTPAARFTPTWTPFRPEGSLSEATVLPATAAAAASATALADASAIPAAQIPPAGEAAPAAILPTGMPPANASAGGATAPTGALPIPYRPDAWNLWVDPLLPQSLRAALSLPPGAALVVNAEQAQARLEFGAQNPLSAWVYALVAPFPTISDGVSSEQLRRAWRGESGAAGTDSRSSGAQGNGAPQNSPPQSGAQLRGEPFAGRPLLLDESTLAALRSLWGEPAPQAVLVLPATELAQYAWSHAPAWAILPFEALQPTWKVLAIDGQSPIHKDFSPAAYPLLVPISLTGDPAALSLASPGPGNNTAPAAGTPAQTPPAPLIPASNRLPERLTVLAMTGVTALVRSTAYAMEAKGIEYPAAQIGGWLREADLTHISNEVPFAADCPAPDPFQPGMSFCSDTRYIKLLEAVGTDIVELTGDHFQDWGVQAMELTLEMYQQRGWPVYGGGANSEAARQAVTLEHNGNRLAFIGCNAKGGSFAQAAANHPGAVVCDFAWLDAEVARLRSQGYLPIVTFQHFEYYEYPAQPDQRRDFRRMAQAGAVIVSGSQAHQPQALEFDAGALIHYGLGNLFFDQYEVSPATRQGFIDRHIFYDGRHISTELLSGVFIDYAQMRPMNADERRELLQAVFAASGW